MADQWFYTCNGQQMDPVPTVELKKLAASGLVKPTDLVWKEGMANWVRASAAKGLFEEGSGSRVLDNGQPENRPNRSGRRDPEEAAPRRRPGRDDDFEPDRPRRPTKEGMGAGAKVAIILGVVILVLGSIVGGVVLLVNSSRDANRNIIAVKDKVKDGFAKVGNNPTVYTINLGDGQRDLRPFKFQANTTYEFLINSDFQPDFDFFIRDQNNINEYHFQTFRNGNHRATWTAPLTGTFQVELSQHGPPTRTQVTIREIGPGFAINPQPKQVFPGPKIGIKDKDGPPVKFVDNPPALGNFLTVKLGGLTKNGTLTNIDPLDNKGFSRAPCHVYSVRMEAGRDYQIDLMSDDFDAFLRLETGNFVELAWNDDFGGSLNSRIVFQCNQTDNYRIICRPLNSLRNPNQGRYTLKVQQQ